MSVIVKELTIPRTPTALEIDYGFAKAYLLMLKKHQMFGHTVLQSNGEEVPAETLIPIAEAQLAELAQQIEAERNA